MVLLNCDLEVTRFWRDSVLYAIREGKELLSHARHALSTFALLFSAIKASIPQIWRLAFALSKIITGGIQARKGSHHRAGLFALVIACRPASSTCICLVRAHVPFIALI